MRAPLAAWWPLPALLFAWCLMASCTPAQEAGGAGGPAATAAERSAGETDGAAAAGELPPAHPDAPTPPKAMLVGSWTPDAEQGFGEPWVDEEGLREVYSLARSSRRIWRGFTTDSDTLPVDLLIRDREGPAVAYVYVLSYRDDATLAFPDAEAVLHVRHRGRMQARLDGELVLDEPPAPGGGWTVARAPVVLTSSYDVLLLKLGRGSPELGESMDVSVQLTAPDGSPIPTQGWYTMRPPGRPSDLVPREEWPQPLPPPDEDGDGAAPADG